MNGKCNLFSKSIQYCQEGNKKLKLVFFSKKKHIPRVHVSNVLTYYASAAFHKIDLYRTISSSGWIE